MKLHLKYLWIVLVACTLTACMNGGGDLAGKWQLRQYQYADGTSEKVDSVFYNFQKGSFSAICLLKDGGLTTFFGNYSLKGAEISIILLPESYFFTIIRTIFTFTFCSKFFSTYTTFHIMNFIFY